MLYSFGRFLGGTAWYAVSLISTAGLVAGLALAGAGYQAWSARMDREHLRPPGKLFEVDGGRMHLHCQGSGSPTVVLEAGNMGFSSTWAWLQAEAAAFTRVCAYDRAGLAWSEPRRGPRDAVTIAGELHALLEAAGERGPYVMVGHSLGGVFAHVFATRYPQDVAGLMFLDASHPNQLEELSERQRALFRHSQRAMRVLPALARLGVLRATNLFGRLAKELPEPDYRAVRAFAATPGHLAASLAELRSWEATMGQARRNRNLGQRPLAVIHAGSTPGMNPELSGLMERLHRDLASWSRHSRYRVVEAADHYSILMSPRFTDVVAAELRLLVEESRPQAG